MVHRLQHRHPVWSAACIHSKLTILTSFYKDQFFGNLSYSSSPVGLDHTGAQTVFTPHVHHWARGTVSGSALFHCRPETVLPVIQQSQSVLCETCLNPFSYVKHISFEDKMFSYSHLLTGATIISVFHFAYRCLIG